MELLVMLGTTEVIIFLMAALLCFLLPIIALVDIVRNRFEGNMQIIWVLIVVFFNIIGTILYFIIGTNQKVLRNARKD